MGRWDDLPIAATDEDQGGLITLAEFADRYGLKPGTCRRWHDRRQTNGFPAPVAWIPMKGAAMGLGFRFEEITRWLCEYAPSVGAPAGNAFGFKPGNYFGRPC